MASSEQKECHFCKSLYNAAAPFCQFCDLSEAAQAELTGLREENAHLKFVEKQQYEKIKEYQKKSEEMTAANQGLEDQAAKCENCLKIRRQPYDSKQIESLKNQVQIVRDKGPNAYDGSTLDGKHVVVRNDPDQAWERDQTAAYYSDTQRAWFDCKVKDVVADGIIVDINGVGKKVLNAKVATHLIRIADEKAFEHVAELSSNSSEVNEWFNKCYSDVDLRLRICLVAFLLGGFLVLVFAPNYGTHVLNQHGECRFLGRQPLTFDNLRQDSAMKGLSPTELKRKWDGLKKADSYDCRYLTSDGLGARVWGWILWLFAATVAWSASFDFRRAPRIYDCKLPVDQGNGKLSVALVQEKRAKSGWSKSLFLAFVVVARAVINVATMGYTFMHLPQRNPAEVANEAQHQVSWFEFPVALVTFVAGIVILMCGNVTYAAYSIKLCANFSSLKFLREASPAVAYTTYTRLSKSYGWLFAICMVLFRTVVFPSIAVWSLISKLRQASFIGSKFCLDWSWSERLIFAMLLNNFASINMDDAAGKEAVFDFVHPHATWFGFRWEQDLDETTAKYLKSKSQAFILALTLDKKHIGKLLNMTHRATRHDEDAQRAEAGRPSLYRRLLLRAATED